MARSPILKIEPLGFPWQTQDPFLFCVHHLDFYPEGNGEFGPKASLQGRNIGNDFTIRDGWRMYHGDKVPGFPAHPHRGFETVTVVQRGMVDHADSLGAAGRYGGGDVQWMTAGSGVQHSEMFPLLNEDGENTLELFQIWLNLPKRNKMVSPHFKMLWRDSIPVNDLKDAAGRAIQLIQYAGVYGSDQAPEPTPDSWANPAENEVAIWVITLDPEAEWTLPAASAGINRSLYFFEGDELSIAGKKINGMHGMQLQADLDLAMRNGSEKSRLLLLQGRPINEPVVQYGPFVMNSPEEIQQTYLDYSQTRFGGWPWDRADQVHGKQSGRFARHADGRLEEPGS